MRSQDLHAVAEEAAETLRSALGACVPAGFALSYDIRPDMGSLAGLTSRLESGLYLVELNPYALLRMSQEEARALVHHEVAHAVDDAVLGWGRDVHGRSWRLLMKLLGHDEPAPKCTLRVSRQLAACLYDTSSQQPSGSLSEPFKNATAVSAEACKGEWTPPVTNTGEETRPWQCQRQRSCVNLSR